MINMCEIVTSNGLIIIGDPSECSDVGINTSTALQDQHHRPSEIELDRDRGIVFEQSEEECPVTNWMKYRMKIEEKFS